jgi:hypothetical protein
MQRIYEFSLHSNLAASPAELWKQAATMEGVNRELFPLARMTYPSGFNQLEAQSLRPGRPLFRSWILALGFLPIDYDDITLVRLEPQGGFLEVSPMGSQRTWRHQRILEPLPNGCRVTDQIRFTPKLPLLGRLYLALFKASFSLRHYNLRHKFGEIQ